MSHQSRTTDARTPELVVFDFDGTLAHRPGMWSQCLLDVLDRHHPGHGVGIDQLRPHVRGRFPWHEPDRAHPELNDPDDWWHAVGTLLVDACRAVEVDVGGGDEVRRAFREHYCDPTRFHLYSDTLAALGLVSSAGVRTAILSNHVPELASIVAHHGLDALVDEVITSALIGVEKPHPEAFAAALGDVPPERAWMIGDNPVADVRGAEAVGMRSVLVRHPDSPVADLLSAVQVALGGAHRGTRQAPDPEG